MLDGTQLRDLAIDQVEQNTSDAWLDEAYAAIEFLVKERDLFTADTVWELVGPTREPRAMGAVFRRATKDGIVKPTNTYWSSTRAKRHAGPVRVWAAVR
jgi:hypothetical protein